jgi:ornithine carbamoyltransferase
MSYALAHRSLLSLDCFTAGEVYFLLEMASDLKRSKTLGSEHAQLRGKNIALLLETASARTLGAFEVAATEQGAHVSCIGPGDSQLAQEESVKDTARVLGRLYDALEYQGSEESTVQSLVQWSGVPVYHGLSKPFHFTEVLADYLTMQEHGSKPLAKMRLAYLADARHRRGDTLLQGAALMGLDFRLAAPRNLWPPQALIDSSQDRARSSGAVLTFTESAEGAVRGVDFICTDDRLEVAGEALESPAELVKHQAENRLHTIKALLVATLT